MRSAQALQEAIAEPEVTVEARYDAATETRRLVDHAHASRHAARHVHRRRLPGERRRRADPRGGRRAARLVHPGAVIRRGDKQLAVRSFKEALDWLLAEARNSTTIQRYKGLGEMNPAQLWETTMDPQVRRLLRVQIEDAITSEEIFSTLMGEQVEPRRAFIESNALGVRNLDV